LLEKSTKAVSIIKRENGLEVTLENAAGERSTLSVDKIITVVGRTPNTDSIGLENIDISTEKGFIPVGDFYETAVHGVYAIGDVVSSPLLAHVASKEGEIAVEHIAGYKSPPRIDPASIPSAIYCEPQIASFGFTERTAKESGIVFEKVVFPFRGVGKSVAMDATDGFVKLLIASNTHELLGVHIIGGQATELIHELLLVKTAGLRLETVASMIHAHPTLSETIMEASRAAEGRAIHS